MARDVNKVFINNTEDFTKLGEIQAESPSSIFFTSRALPAWSYNLSVMVHGASREECSVKSAEIRTLLGHACRASDIL